ncbi:hypothetical protein ACQKFE_16015 [Stutzerimonas stutzeri]|uniref:hypothetical protein n=1 Tax=Stutzerimonas stutzeri TaxID=316 RepID=UPI003CFF895A
MTEKSIDKTKRKMIDLFKDYEWNYQYSIFYGNPANSIHLLEDLGRLTIKLKTRNQPFYIIKRTLNRGHLQAYATIFTTEQIEDMDKLVSKSSEYEINIPDQVVTDDMIVSTINAMKKQRLHDLDKFFGKADVKRYSVTNKSKLVKRDISLSIDEKSC